MDPRLDRIQKLMALAMKNPNEEEARSAAVKCLALMVEHNVTITMPQAAPPPYRQAPSQSQYDTLRDLMRQAQQGQQPPTQQSYNDMFGNYGWNPFK